MTSAVIVAAGSSRRMGFDKLSVELAGMPVLIRSVLAFQNCEAIDHIVVVTSRERLPEVERQRGELNLSKWHQVVEGDAERHLSVHRGLLAVPEGAGLVAVHDGARPLVTPGAISRCVAAARSSMASVSRERPCCARPISLWCDSTRSTSSARPTASASAIAASIDRKSVV